MHDLQRQAGDDMFLYFVKYPQYGKFKGRNALNAEIYSESNITYSRVVQYGVRSGQCLMCFEHIGTGKYFSGSVPFSSNLLFY